MSNNNNSSNQTQANQDQTQSYDNDTVTGVEVVKDDTVVYEDGDFEEYNEAHDFEEDSQDSLAKDSSTKDSIEELKQSVDQKSKNDKDGESQKASEDKNTDKEQMSNEADNAKNDADSDKEKSKSSEDDKDSQDSKAGKKDSADKEDKSSSAMAGIYQWASKLKDDLTSDTGGMTQDVSEKATAMMLGKLVDAADLELAAFDKSLEVAKNLIATAEERREKIVARKDKYQGMIDQLDQE